MIKTFESKNLQNFYETGKSAKIDARMHRRLRIRLDALSAAMVPEHMNLPGFNFHGLEGQKKERFTVHVNGPWCVTFGFESEDAIDVDFEQYH